MVHAVLHTDLTVCSVSELKAAQPASFRASSSSYLRLLSRCSRIQSHRRSTGLSSGEYGGRKSSVMFSGTFSSLDLCQPAWSKTNTACRCGPTSRLSHARCWPISSVHTCVATMHDEAPRTGFTEAKRCTDLYLVCRTTLGRDARGAHTLVSVPFCPKRASSWNQTSTCLPGWCSRTP